MIHGLSFGLQVRELPPGYLLSGVRRGAGYAKGLWVRLNGGGRPGNRQEPLPAELPVPVSTKVRPQAFVFPIIVEMSTAARKSSSMC